MKLVLRLSCQEQVLEVIESLEGDEVLVLVSAEGSVGQFRIYCQRRNQFTAKRMFVFPVNFANHHPRVLVSFKGDN